MVHKCDDRCNTCAICGDDLHLHFPASKRDHMFTALSAEELDVPKPHEDDHTCYPDADGAAEISRLRAALERIRNRAQRIISGEIQCTTWSAAEYDDQVASKVLGLPCYRDAPPITQSESAITSRQTEETP